MKDYMAIMWEEERPEPNDNFYRRNEEKPRHSLHEAVEYEKTFVNSILNQPEIDESDRQNIADVVCWLSYQLLTTCDNSKSFEEYIAEVNGREWYDKMITGWLRIEGNRLAERLNCPELYSPEAVFLIKPEEEEE